MATATAELIACACNRSPHALDWHSTDLIAFGTGNFVAIYNPTQTEHRGGVNSTLQGHAGRVNTVRFVRNVQGSTVPMFVSGSADCTAKLWRKASDDDKWECAGTLTGHKNPIISVNALQLPGDTTHILIVTASTDGTIGVYEYNTGSDEFITPVQSIDVGVKNALDVSLTALPASADSHFDRYGVLLATGNTDNKVHLYTRGIGLHAQFTKSVVLSGHEDWVTSVSFMHFQPESKDQFKDNATISHWAPGDVILASGSEDKYIRLWRISHIESSSATDNETSPASNETDIDVAQAMLDAFSDSLSSGLSLTDVATNILGNSLGSTGSTSAKLTTSAHVLSLSVNTGETAAYAVSLDSVLSGHDGWVHSVSWNQVRTGFPALISTSADSSVVVWTPDPSEGVWSSVVRLGEAGGAVLGFLGASMDAHGRSIFAYGYHGSFHMWRYKNTDDEDRNNINSGPIYSTGYWEPQISLSGHFGSVQDVVWDPRGNYVLSVSKDQTARLYSPWVAESKAVNCENSMHTKMGWFELARPQIHGYDMRCAAFVTPFKYVSGSDEKVVRVFQATQQFTSSWHALNKHADRASESEEALLPVGASLPALGLSNKAVESAQVEAARAEDAADPAELGLNDSYSMRQSHIAVQATASVLAKDGSSSEHGATPPLEEYLLRHTLWPEDDKLYGHPYEIFTVAAAHNGDIIATSCKAASEKHANIRLYSTKNWKPPMVKAPANNEAQPSALQSAAPLPGHTLTITRMAFSPGTDQYLLSVSRDRSWAIYQRCSPLANIHENGVEVPMYESQFGPYRLLHRQAKAHARILWDAAWAPDATFFATASRDKTIKLWSMPKDNESYSAKPVTLQFPDSVTAVDFVSAEIKSDKPVYVMAVGLESGRVFVLTGCAENGPGAVPVSWTPTEIPRNITHISTINRLAWCPRLSEDALTAKKSWLLASASDDQSVRIFSVESAAF